MDWRPAVVLHHSNVMRYFSDTTSELENVASATYCILRPPDVAPVFMSIKYEAHNASAYNSTIPQPTRTHNAPKYQISAELLRLICLICALSTILDLIRGRFSHIVRTPRGPKIHQRIKFQRNHTMRSWRFSKFSRPVFEEWTMYRLLLRVWGATCTESGKNIVRQSSALPNYVLHFQYVASFRNCGRKLRPLED